MEDQEIEITPEMIAAGARVYLRESDDTFEEIVAEIYRAMEGARRQSAATTTIRAATGA